MKCVYNLSCSGQETISPCTVMVLFSNFLGNCQAKRDLACQTEKLNKQQATNKKYKIILR